MAGSGVGLLWAHAALAAPHLHLPPIFPQEIAAADPVVGAQIRVIRAQDQAEAGAGAPLLLEALYLEDGDAVVEAYAGLARVTVHHAFVNADPDLQGEAAYLLPLPPDAQVDQVEVRCDTVRRIASVEPRRPDEVQGQGGASALDRFVLDAEGVLAWAFGSICAGEIGVIVQYTVPLSVAAGGRLGLRLPPEPGAPPATPWSVADDPPRQGVTVYTDPGMPLAEGRGRHAVLVVHPCEGERQEIVLGRDGDADVLEGEGVWLSWELVGAAATIYRPDPQQPGYIALTISPALLGQVSARRPRDLLLVVDRSCSMAGPPAALARSALLGAIDTLTPDDRFNVYALSEERRPLFAAPQPPSPQATADTLAWLQDSPRARSHSGAPGLRAALASPPATPDGLRMLLLLTDGHFDDTGLREAVQDAPGDPRLYAVGLGTYPNRSLLDSLAHITRGDALYPNTDTDPHAEAVEDATQQILDHLQPPTLTDVEIDWGGLQAFQQHPLRLPDLHDDEPLRVVARYEGPLDPSEGGEILIRISGRRGTLPTVLELPVTLLPQQPHHQGIASLWAAEQIDALATHPAAEQQPERIQQLMTDLAVQHHLLTRYSQLASPDLDPSALHHAALTPRPAALPPALAALDWKQRPPSPPPPLPSLPPLASSTAAGAPVREAPSIQMSTVGMNIPTGEAADPIRRLVDARQGQIRHCYEQRLKVDPRLEGQLTVEVEVAAGQVQGIWLSENTTGDGALGACALERVARWEYPESATGRLALPFRLSTQRR